jgi:AcrR family transcriptional regulator
MSLSDIVVSSDVTECNQVAYGPVARWKPNAVGRLQEAAMELYRQPGYDQVTVADIAARAGLTPRTFFRYFPDKREVLFFGAEQHGAFLAENVVGAPEQTPALEAVATALASVAQLSDEDPAHADFTRQRHAVIRSYAELRERELSKYAALASVIASALRSRGVAEPAARLAAEAGLSAFKVGFERWVDDPKRRKMRDHLRDAMGGLRSVILGSVVLEQVATRGKAPAVEASQKTTPAERRRR